MKTLSDYMTMSYRMEIIEDNDEGGFVASYPELPGCLTCGETIEAAVANALDAKKAWLEAALEDGIHIPEPSNLEDYSGQFKLRIPKSLHRSLAEHSKKEGISMNQYCVYLLSQNDSALHKAQKQNRLKKRALPRIRECPFYGVTNYYFASLSALIFSVK